MTTRTTGTWLKLYADVVCKLRGYKSPVRSKTIMEAGDFSPDKSQLDVKVNDRGEVTASELALS